MAHGMSDAATASDEELDQRPTEPLPVRQLVQIALYWLGINVIWGGIGIVIQERVPELVPAGEAGFFIALQSWITIVIAIITQPTIGAISDYTISRWGRRKPYIAIGATLDVVFVIGVATSQTYLSLVAFLFLLQFSSNFAQGPFQGYVPDLVPLKQVGLASALVGAMQTLGFVAGAIVISISYQLGDFTIPTIALGVIEFVTAVGTLLWVREGKAARDRHGRSWVDIGRSAWGLDILRERSFVFLVVSRLMFLAGINVLLGFYVLFMERALAFGDEEKGFWVPLTLVSVAALTAVSTVPSAILSNRIGRKPVIYIACAVGGVGLLISALATGPEIFLAGALLMGTASGTFLAVDWALMTDIIPKASSGRFMGISNIAVALGGPVASTIAGPIIDIVGGVEETGAGPRAAFLAGIALFALAAVFLRPVDSRPREVRLAAAASPS